MFRAAGAGARTLFQGEIGGHRFQRVPPNERRGRVHSSTITVAILDEEIDHELVIPEVDLEWATCRSPGKGGQHVNKTDSAVQLTHLPTGLQVRSHDGRSQHQNRLDALRKLREHLERARREEVAASRAASRRLQVGSGMRGDKRRTVREQEGTVVDHETGRTWRLRDYVRGAW